MRTVLGTRLAEINPVVIVEPAISVRMTRRISPLHRRIDHLGKSKTGWRYHPLHFPQRIPGLWNAMRAFNRTLLRQELSRLLPPGITRIVCYDSPEQHHLVRKLGEELSIYNAIDDRTRTVWGQPISGELEKEKLLLGKVDAVICVSEFLSEILKARIPADHSKSVYVLPNGYDNNLFDPTRNHEMPSVLADVPKPSILVAGHVSERIDWDGIGAAVRARPEWTWVFIGPADQGLPEKIAALGSSETPGGSNSPRLLWKPPVPIEQMPAVIAHCDASAVPYRLNPFTMASSPLKGVEYLGMGVPVLSTQIPSLRRYGSAIEWVEEGNGESYARALDNVKLELGSRSASEARRTAVSGDSHDDHVRKFLQIISNEIERKRFQAGRPKPVSRSTRLDLVEGPVDPSLAASSAPENDNLKSLSFR
jgi:glycosyltransferase involved in cell wall biosynthesis